MDVVIFDLLLMPSVSQGRRNSKRRTRRKKRRRTRKRNPRRLQV
jgi:hypothetical protein